MEFEFKEILDIGLEIEFSNLRRDTSNFMANLMKNLNNFRHVHDASSETPEICIGNIPIQFKVGNETNKLLSIMGNKGFEVLGGELNSPILHGNEFQSHIYKLIDFLIDMGESFSTTEQDTRGSIHVHVNVSKDIKHEHMIRLLELGLATESIFYRLGGMGRVNRGTLNNFIYQRPLTLPPCIIMRDKVYPIFDYKDLLKSDDKTDFYNKYGDTIYHIRSGNHYVTQRYTGLNFYSIPYRGSIEFRYANKVLVPEWICAWITLCQSFVNYALTKPKDDSFENVYRKLEDNKDIPEEELTFIFNKLDIPEDSQITLLDIWQSSELPSFNGEQVLTHLNNPTYFTREINYLPHPILSDVKRVNVEDVRVINSEKNKILNNRKRIFDEVDYVIDTSGVKSKLKNIEFLLHDPYNHRRMNDGINHNWMLAGFNINNYSHRDAVDWSGNRILREKFLPFAILRTSSAYEFNTKWEELKIILNIHDDMQGVNATLYHRITDRYSEEMYFETIYSDTYNSQGYNFKDVINDAHFNPETFFGDDMFDEMEGEENNDENFDEIFEEEEDNNDNIPRLRVNPPQRLVVNNNPPRIHWEEVANDMANGNDNVVNNMNRLNEVFRDFRDFRNARRNNNNNNEERE